MTIPLQCCAECGAAQYPKRDVCRVCLSDDLATTPDAGLGVLLAHADIHHSFDAAFAATLPLTIGTVLLDAGIRLIALVEGAAMPGARVSLRETQNANGVVVFTATPAAS